jgi:hypothetical protein
MPDFGSPFRKGATPQNNGVGVYYRTTTDPSIMQWNVNVQRQIRNYASVTIAYVGSRGVNLLRQIDLNPVQSQLRDGESVFGDPTGTRQARPLARQNRSFGSLTYNKADGWSRYHSLQTSLTRRFDHGLQAQVSYTLSRCTDLSSGTLGAADGGTPATNPYDPGYDQGPCAFDRTHNFRGSGIYALPFTGHALTRGWQMSAIVSAVSGRPFTPSIGFDRSGLLTANQRPNLVAGHTIDDVYTGNIAQWFDPAAFELPAVGTLGTVGRNTLRAPKFFTIDLAVTKSLTLKATSVELRVEAFNVTNHTNFNPPAANIFLVSPSEPSRPYSPTAGQITSALAPRQLQLAVKLTF